MTEMSKPARVVHDLVVELIGVEMQPGHCDTIATTLLGGYVPADEPGKAYQQGVDDTISKTHAVGPAVEALGEAKELLGHAKAWEGPEEWRDEQIARIDYLITLLS